MTRVDFTPDPDLYPFQSRWFDSSAGRMHYIDEGTGPTIVFFHGQPMWSFLYRNIIADLRHDFRCIAMEYLGFGLSDRPAGYSYRIEDQIQMTGQLIDHLGVDDYITVGLDWGGPISMGVAVDRADRVAGVVLGNTWFWPREGLRNRLLYGTLSCAPVAWATLHRNLFVERVIPAATSRALTSAEMDHYRGVQPSPEARVALPHMPKQVYGCRPLLDRLAHEVPARLGAKPTLIPWG